MKQKLSEDQTKRYQELYAAYIKASRRAQLAKAQFDAYELELHLDTPDGHRFDLWGTGELKANKDCKAHPGAE